MALDAAPAKGHCAQCDALNYYANTTCNACGARLPWADAIVAGQEKARTAMSSTAIIIWSTLGGLVILGLAVLIALYGAGLVFRHH